MKYLLSALAGVLLASSKDDTGTNRAIGAAVVGASIGAYLIKDGGN